jgi:aminoglycoside 6'-N-acetyltransferase I
MQIERLNDWLCDAWIHMRSELWPDCTVEHTRRDLEDFKANLNSMAVFVAIDGSGKACGFVETRLRDVAESCETHPVGYLEGIYVSPECRGQGVGRKLAAAAERWAISRDCREMASDCLYDNEASVLFHQRIGYEVTGQLIHFRRELPSGG